MSRSKAIFKDSNDELFADGLLSAEQALDFLSIGLTLFNRLVKNGVIPSVKIARARRIPKRGLIRYLQSVATSSTPQGLK